jgi:hypothetical protein
MQTHRAGATLSRASEQEVSQSGIA